MSATVLIGQAPTNLGPLTTTFTPPAACTVAVGAGHGGLLGLIRGGDKDVAYLGQGCSQGKAFDATSCWPQTSQGAKDQPAPLHGWGFYSPGLSCPVGYATACSATGGSGGGSGWPVQFKLRDGETAVGCCPNGYGCANINGQTCTMLATSTTVQTATCDGNKIGDLGVQTVPDSRASITAFSLFAPMIQINWQSSDRPQSTSTTSASTITATTTTTPPSSSSKIRPTDAGTRTIDTNATSSPETLVLDGNPQTTGGNMNLGGGAATTTPSLHDDSTSSDGGSPSLSSGAKVAIGVGGTVAVLMMLVCALFYCWRRRKNRREEQELDRLYGVKEHSMTPGGDFTSSGDIPGWYRGQRLVTPTKDPFGGGVAEVQRPVPASPAVPYYRPYRP